MVNFEPGEYMRMFFQSVTQAARKKKVLPIKVKPITFWLLESRICTNNQKVACVQTTPLPSGKIEQERRRRSTREGVGKGKEKIGFRLCPPFSRLALVLSLSLACSSIFEKNRKQHMCIGQTNSSWYISLQVSLISTILRALSGISK